MLPSSTAGRASRFTLLLSVAVALLSCNTPLGAQYFGRNKVVYKAFDFRVLRTPHYDVHFYREEAPATRDAARMAERWYARHTPLFRDTVGRRSLIFYASPADFQQTNVVPDALEEGIGGVTEGYRSRVILPHTGVYAETDHVLGHELVHVYQYSAADSKEGGGLQRAGALPLWLVEGMAEYISIGRADPQTAMWMRSAILRNKIPAYKDLVDPRIFPYRYGQALCAYIGGRWGDDQLVALYKNALRFGPDAAIKKVTGLTPNQLVEAWATAMRATYEPAMAGRADPRTAGDEVLGGREKEPGFDVAPVASPDGKYVAFFSSRGLFSIDIFVAEAATGRIVKRLTSPTGSAHFDAISFLYTAGTWSPDAKEFAFVTFANGRNELAILDVGRGSVTRSLAVKGVGSISSPTWSPDGQRIAFSGTSGGISDLYLFDLATNAVTQITNDKYADIQPAWSPDGKSIAFVTDRGNGADLNQLRYAPLSVGVLNVDSREVRLLALFPQATNLNPQWSPNGDALYFLSTPDGFPDIYRVSLTDGALSRVTRLATGVSGIAALSPAISVASKTGQLFFSVFDRTGYRIVSLDAARAQGERVVADAPPSTAGVLPPADALATSIVERNVHDPVTGLSAGTEYAEQGYAPKLHLDAIAPPTIGVGTSRYGTMLLGGIGASFSDELGNRNLGVAVSAQGDVRDIGGQVYYADLKHRWQNFVAAARSPYLSVFTTVDQTTVPTSGGDAQGLLVSQYLLRTYVDQATVGTMYPFSPTRRAEFSIGASRISYNTQVQRLVDVGGTLYDLGRSDTTSPGGLGFGQASVALVGDNSFSGFSSPVAGGRYRLEVSPAYGTLKFTTLTADVRKYFFMRPLTFAVRGLHFGRYGTDGESNRLSPLYVGDGSLVRGYSVYSFDPAECTPSSNSRCPEFDRLIGSRVGVANAELRIPLFGSRELGVIPTRFLPIEVSPFVDAGIAWTKDDPAKLKFERTSNERIPIVSAGVSSRINLFGYAVVEIFYAHPFQRPMKSAVWGFQLLPGW